MTVLPGGQRITATRRHAPGVTVAGCVWSSSSTSLSDARPNLLLNTSQVAPLRASRHNPWTPCYAHGDCPALDRYVHRSVD